MNDIIVSTWGIGPTYRQRVIHNIVKALSTGYDKILPYVILTDHPEDFFDLKSKTDKIIDIININDVREKFSPWSKEFEYISTENDQSKYGEDYRTKTNDGLRFSYGLHRFSLPRISELGYRKFLMCDSDTDIRYDKIVNGKVTETEFWEQFNTPVNTMKGCDIEIFNIDAIHYWANGNIILSNILRYMLSIKFPQYSNNIKLLHPTYTQTEGPFRFYHLKSSEMVKEYFEILDETTKMSLISYPIRQQLSPGVYMYIDNVLVSMTNEVLDITPMNFEHLWYTVNVYKSDRYFFPSGAQTYVSEKHLSLQPASSVIEFNEINKELIDHLKSIGQWNE